MPDLVKFWNLRKGLAKAKPPIFLTAAAAAAKGEAGWWGCCFAVQAMAQFRDLS